MEDDRVAILEQQLAQAKLIAEEADKKYEEVYGWHQKPFHLHRDVFFRGYSFKLGARFRETLVSFRIYLASWCRQFTCSDRIENPGGHWRHQRNQLIPVTFFLFSQKTTTIVATSTTTTTVQNHNENNIALAKYWRTVHWPMKSVWMLLRTNWKRLASLPRRPTKNTTRCCLALLDATKHI